MATIRGERRRTQETNADMEEARRARELDKNWHFISSLGRNKRTHHSSAGGLIVGIWQIDVVGRDFLIRTAQKLHTGD